MLNKITFFLILSVASITAFAETHSVESPSKILRVEVLVENGEPFYRVYRHSKVVIDKSRLGFIVKKGLPLAYDFKIEGNSQSTFDETWTQSWGEEKNIRNHYNQLTINLVEQSTNPRQMNLIFRVFDDGIGFRYEIPKQTYLDKFEIMDELTEFVLTDDHIAWWVGAYQYNRYEYLYTKSRISEMPTAHTPLTMESNDSLVISIHEAALIDFASMTLARNGVSTNSLKADLVPWSDGVKVKTQTPMLSPWRTIQIADNPGKLITSYLILNLNEPNKLGDVSWVKPGKYVGIWWEMHLNKATWGSGERHGATTENAMKYIDFAAKHGFSGVLIEGWNYGWDGDWVRNGDKFDFTTPYDDFDLQKVSDYALSKGTRIIGHHETGGGIENYENQMMDAYRLYNRMGIKAIKSGYVKHAREIERTDENGQKHGEWHHGQYMVRHYQKALEAAARQKLMINAHEPIKDTGLRRTFPNMMTREGARGQEFNAWGYNNGNPPEHTTILPFTRMLSGPMDFTPGIFDLKFEEYRPDNQINTTLIKQLALYVVLYSPLHMAADLPENYEANPRPFQFIKDVPVDWETTQVPHAKIGEYLTVVRKDRNSDDWYIGSITNENPRELSLSLDFLPKNKMYVAEIYRDGDNAHWDTNPYDIEIESRLLSPNETLLLKLASGGGQAIRIRPASNDDVKKRAPGRQMGR